MPEPCTSHRVAGRWTGWVLLGAACLYAASLLMFSGAVEGLTAWYSAHPAHRQQTEALLHGELALSPSPTAVRHDLVWARGGVHQVWGLGVPLWRLPFEAAARAVGLPGFPDRLALAFFMALVGWIILRSILEVGAGKAAAFAEGTGAAVVLLFFPGLLSMLRCRMSVYEEVLVYVYFYGLLLGMSLWWLARAPSPRRFWVVSALSGLSGLIRPTLVLYGLATLAVGTWLVVGASGRFGSKGGVPVKGSRRRANRAALVATVCWGVAVFVVGGGILWASNRARFGDGFEFGHSLNIQHEVLMGSVYATRFGDPFAQEPLWRAARELIGAAFFVRQFNGGDWYAAGVFDGQAPTVRWREFYFTTFDLAIAAAVSLAWVTTLWAACRRVRSGAPSLDTRPLPGQERASPGDSCGQPLGEAAGLVVLGAWSALACGLLAVLYLRSPVLSSRYVMDFAPGFAVATVVAWKVVVRWLGKLGRWGALGQLLALALLGFWSVWANASARNSYGRPRPLSWPEVKTQLAAAAGTGTPVVLPASYAVGVDPRRWGIPYNGTGWDWRTGLTRPSVILFVSDPEFLELELTTDAGAAASATPDVIRAKVGLEWLVRQSVKQEGNRWIIRFGGPRQARYQRGIHPVFVGMVAKEHLGDRVSPWHLEEVRWRSAGSGRGSDAGAAVGCSHVPSALAAAEIGNNNEAAKTRRNRWSPDDQPPTRIPRPIPLFLGFVHSSTSGVRAAGPPDVSAGSSPAAGRPAEPPRVWRPVVTAATGDQPPPRLRQGRPVAIPERPTSWRAAAPRADTPPNPPSSPTHEPKIGRDARLGRPGADAVLATAAAGRARPRVPTFRSWLRAGAPSVDHVALRWGQA